MMTGLAEERDGRAVAPVDLGGLQALRALLLLAQLAQDPAPLLAQRDLDIVQAHPPRRVHAQALGPRR
jgi:hypothetical protein